MDKFFRTNSSILEERLDPSFYQPSLVSNDELIKSKGWVELNTFYRSSGIGNTSGVERYYSDSADSIPYISGKAIKSFNIDFDGCQRVTADSHKNELAKSTLKSGDVLVIRKGDMGNACVVPSDVNEANCSSEVIYLKMKDSSEPYFLVSYLNCEQGQKAFKRLGRGTIIPGVSLLDVPFLPVPQFSETAQKYIGDKVRQAEQLRAWAKSVKQQAAELLPAYIREIQQYEAKSYRAKDIVPERLDSLFYHPDYIALERKMKAKGCNRLGLVAKQIKDSWNKKKAETFEYYEIGGLDITTGQVLSTKTQTVGAPSRAKTKVQQGDVLVSTVRPNRKNVGFIVGSVTDSEMVATSGFSVLRFSSLARAAFYHAWLRTDDATAQLMRWNSGSAYPAIDDDVPLNIIVPEFEQEFVDSWGQKLLDAQFAYVYARKLTEAAKTLVETLIEGQLTEQQLIQAHQALEDGDNSLDQAILGKLGNEGYAIEGSTPLFSELDELYRLLESAAQAEAEA